ncbi:MAG: hypothetical protein HY924_03030 [Elusimicrobia bacterium]|nr:hypothetical protein [Elusimicrobiota bacterium]
MKLHVIMPFLAWFALFLGTAPVGAEPGAGGASPAAADPKPEPRKAAKAKKKGYDYEKSKYKSDALSGSEPRTYKFNKEGEPILPSSKRKATGKKGKADSSEEGPGPDEAAEPESAGEGQAAPAAEKAGAKKVAPVVKEEYSCAMGDYRGPRTSDGRCPKCGMALQKVQQEAGR